MVRFILLFLFGVTLLTSQAKALEPLPIEDMPGGIYKMDKSHASLVWKVSHLGLSNYTARFTNFDAKIFLDPIHVTKSHVIAKIDPTSIRTDYPYPEKKDFDKKLIDGSDWFNASAFPEIKYLSTDIEQTGENTGTINGTLTFLGVSKPLSLDVTFNKALGNHPFVNKPVIGFSAKGTLKRSDFGMKAYIPNIGDEVTFMVEAEFIQEE